MIDWFVFLFTGLILLIFFMPMIAEHKQVSEYWRFPYRFGLSQGSYMLLFRFSTGTTIIFSIYITATYGFFISFLIAFSIFFLLLMFSKSSVFIRRKWLSENNSSLSFNHTLTSRAKYIFLFLIFLGNTEGMVLQGLLMGVLFEQMFSIPFSWVYLFAAFFCFVFAGLGGSVVLQKVGTLFIRAIFISTMFISSGLFLLKGIQPSYIRLSEFNNFIKTDSSFFLLVIAIFMVGGGMLLSDLFVQRSIINMKEKRVGLITKITAFCTLSILLSFSAIAMYFLTYKPSTFTFFDVLENIPTTIHTSVLYFFMLAIVSGFLGGFGISLYSSTSLFLNYLEQRKNNYTQKHLLKSGYFFSGFMCLFVYIIITLFQFDITNIVLFYSTLYASLLFPIVLIFFRKKKLGMFHPILIITGMIIGITIGTKNGVLIAIASSSVATLTGFILFHFKTFLKKS